MLRTMRRLGLAAAAVVLLAAGGLAGSASAHVEPAAQAFRVYIVPHLSAGDLMRLSHRGAVGLVVPGVGPTTNRRRALAALVRGELQNARLGGIPRGRVLIGAIQATGVPSVSPAIIISMPPRGRPILNDRRYPIAVVGPGFHGLLRSPTTRIPGLVSILDIAPTALGRARGSLSSLPALRPAAAVARLDRRIGANNRIKLPALLLAAGIVVLLALVRPAAGIAALPAALLGSLLLGALGPASIPLLLVGLAACTAVGGLVLGRLCSSWTALLGLFALVLVAYVVTMALEPTWVAVTPLGPTQNSRFYGVGNQLETLLLAPIVTGAALAGRRFGLAGYVAFGALGLVAVADNGFGSDGGGAIVLGVALARLRLRGFLVALAVSALGVLAMVWFDFQQGGPDHLRSAFSSGLGGLLAVARNRVPLAYEPAVHQWYLVGPAALAFAAAAVLLIRAERTRLRRDMLLSLTGAILVSLLVNDSAAYVLIGGVAMIVAVGRSTLRFAPLGLVGEQSLKVVSTRLAQATTDA